VGWLPGLIQSGIDAPGSVINQNATSWLKPAALAALKISFNVM